MICEPYCWASSFSIEKLGLGEDGIGLNCLNSKLRARTRESTCSFCLAFWNLGTSTSVSHSSYPIILNSKSYQPESCQNTKQKKPIHTSTSNFKMRFIPFSRLDGEQWLCLAVFVFSVSSFCLNQSGTMDSSWTVDRQGNRTGERNFGVFKTPCYLFGTIAVYPLLLEL